ncbi:MULTISPECIES: cytochrome c [unclassified Variovorax]|jgi:mono/diheme cytochrome c family protein|uniref:cytochrome c n=1 Tax=unclassified Variovorax TaxID=663243 RepID=UPI0008AC330D|nr:MULTISPECIES: cytochrome c [unclassified Variovorax]SEK13411.1 Cytochrome c, mono-and diheme variants [Variovorax sp. OK202]SFD85507.1 Cytochrome c, mono-and diheme variants [Variovorax sp. OK212]
MTKKFLWAFAGITVLVVGVVLILALWPTTTRTIATASDSNSQALIDKGRYLAQAGDCVACHTSPGGMPFTGGLPLASPIGAMYSTNITPDRDSGIGKYTLADFDRAVRHGIRADGASLYPAMPYPSYARMSDDDVRALYAFFMHGVTPAQSSPHPHGIPWPLSMRWPMALWRKAFAPQPDAVAFDPARYPDISVARGAYLVQGLGHCGSCHTPRAPTMQEKALDESGADYLAGGPLIDGWVAVNLRGNPADGLGAWSTADIVATLRSARNMSRAVVGGAMNEAVVHSTQHLSEDDLKAIAAFLKTLPPSAHSPSSFNADPATAKALWQGVNATRGTELYVDNCAACHRSDGLGYAQAFPRLAGNSSVLASDPSSVIRLILDGSRLPATRVAPSELAMPGFGWRLSDDEVAQLASFTRQSWGNQASAVQAEQVGTIRRAIEKERAAQAAAAR